MSEPRIFTCGKCETAYYEGERCQCAPQPCVPLAAGCSIHAAAPDLLAALKAIVAAFGPIKRLPYPLGEGETYLSPAAAMVPAELIEAAIAAIAKAEEKP